MVKIVGSGSKAQSHLSTPPRRGCRGFQREVKQLRRRRLRKHHLKREFALFQTFVGRSVRQMLENFSGVKFSRTGSKYRKRIGKSLSSC